jgi:hypothetical protein
MAPPFTSHFLFFNHNSFRPLKSVQTRSTDIIKFALVQIACIVAFFEPVHPLL